MFNPLRVLTTAVDTPDAGGAPEATLAKALKSGWLEVWYQPRVHLQSSRVIGAEALIRLRHPQAGVLGPSEFLPGSSEQDRLTITEQVLATALRDWADCAEAFARDMKLSVNVPATALARLDISKTIRELRPHSAEWPGLTIEVTEDEALHDVTLASEIAAELRSQNCGLAIDDFGAGYSSLARLRQLPFTELNIHRGFIAGCHRDKMNAGILESIVELAHRFGLITVAEGIETLHESHKLQGLGCTFGQGFLFGKPMPKDDFIATTGRKPAGPVQKRSWWSGGRPEAGR